MTASRVRTGIVLVNLGTPDAPTARSVRRYLRAFLADRRVIEMPRLLWWPILHLLVLPLRPRRLAHLYQGIWQQGDSPMRHILGQQCARLQDALQRSGESDCQVRAAMTYGKPALTAVLDALQAEGMERLIVLPLFPQYSATSTAAVYDVVARWCLRQRNLPALTLLKDYHREPAYIDALAASVRQCWHEQGRAEKLLLSFHGIPRAYADKGDPYAEQCRATAAALASALQLTDAEWALSFQSRFGAQQWLQPYTDGLLAEWAKAGVRSVQVVCPAFSADCLETLEEIAEQNREVFLRSGGQSYHYIPALNADAAHIQALLQLLLPHIHAHQSRQD